MIYDKTVASSEHPQILNLNRLALIHNVDLICIWRQTSKFYFKIAIISVITYDDNLFPFTETFLLK